jgi:transcriptional regulator with XRE-family HTH domain
MLRRSGLPQQDSPLCRARRTRNWTLERLVEEIDLRTPGGHSGVTPSMVSGWELGRDTTSIGHRAMLCGIFGQAPDELFAHQDESLVGQSVEPCRRAARARRRSPCRERQTWVLACGSFDCRDVPAEAFCETIHKPFPRKLRLPEGARTRSAACVHVPETRRTPSGTLQQGPRGLTGGTHSAP